MTPEQIEEHNRTFNQAVQLVENEIILHGRQYPSLQPSVRLRLDQALRMFARVLEINPRNWGAMWMIGKVYQRFGDPSTALTWFVRAHGIEPSQHDVAREASLCAMAVGRPEEAIEYAQSALRSQPSNSSLHANLAVAFLLAGRLDEARAAIDKAMMGDPADPISQTVRRMIDYFIASGRRPPNTVEALEEYLRIH